MLTVYDYLRCYKTKIVSCKSGKRESLSRSSSSAARLPASFASTEKQLRRMPASFQPFHPPSKFISASFCDIKTGKRDGICEKLQKAAKSVDSPRQSSVKLSIEHRATGSRWRLRRKCEESSQRKTREREVRVDYRCV